MVQYFYGDRLTIFHLQRQVRDELLQIRQAIGSISFDLRVNVDSEIGKHELSVHLWTLSIHSSVHEFHDWKLVHEDLGIECQKDRIWLWRQDTKTRKKMLRVLVSIVRSVREVSCSVSR